MAAEARAAAVPAGGSGPRPATGTPRVTISWATPEVTLSPAGHDFGARQVDAGPSAAFAFTLANPGDTPLTIQTIRLAGGASSQYRLDADCPDTLGAGGDCRIRVRFDPKTPGEQVTTLTVATSAGSATATLAGRGSTTLVPPRHASMRRPFVTRVTPNSGPTTGGRTIIIRGENFTDGTGILFGDTPASSVRIVNHTTLRVVTPAHAPGGYDVTAVNRNGRSPQVDAAAFTFVRPGLRSNEGSGY